MRNHKTQFGFLILFAICVAASPALARDPLSRPHAQNPVDIVRAVMAMPDDKIDFAKAKLVFDKIYNPSVDVDASLRQIDGMAQTIRAMAGPSAPARLRLIMLRKFIYDPGPWNGNSPFQYDMSDPLGHKPANRLLATYLRTHRGNCVSMPILFVALAQRLGLQATLSTAPNHMFVKYTDDVTGRTFNLETTSGAYPARDVYIRQGMPMTDAAIANGLYMKTLSRKEALAVMATIAIEGAFASRQFQAGWDIAKVLLPYYPNNLVALLDTSVAAAGIIDVEYRERYPRQSDIPAGALGRFHALEIAAAAGVNHAYALGWRETDGETQPTTTVAE